MQVIIDYTLTLIGTVFGEQATNTYQDMLEFDFTAKKRYINAATR